METKLLIASQDTRLYGSKFGLVTWKYEIDDEGNVLFDGNELELLDIRDCGMDFSATHVKDAKWFQHRKYWFLEDLIDYNKNVKTESKFKLVDELQRRIKDSNYQISQKRRDEYQSRIKELKGLEDRLGTDKAFPVVELVTEYRKDRWITFSPYYNLIIRDIKNPYKHKRIPIAQLRYYPLQDDPIGESEVEPVLPLWKAIQAVVCGYLDEMNIKMRPPIKIIEGAARIETIVYGPEAQWLVSRQDAVQEMQSNGEAQKWFNTTYSALVSAFNTAMGDMSQGISNVSPFEGDKTATEINKISQQQLSRDQRNQNELSEFITDIMGMWLENNKQFLFSDRDKDEYILRIVGDEMFNYFKRSGLDQMELPDSAASMLADIIEMNPEISESELDNMVQAAEIPRYPVERLFGKDDFELYPKMRMNDMNDSAEVSLIPEDLNGNYDYIADVKSMSISAGQELKQGLMRAVEMLTSNQLLIGQLQQEGYQTQVKQLLTSTLEEFGLKDSERFFEKINDQEGPINQAAQVAGSPGENPQQQGLPGTPQAIPQTGNGQQPMA